METQQPSNSKLPSIFITFVITAIIVGGGVYLWQKMGDTKDNSTQTTTANPENTIDESVVQPVVDTGVEAKQPVPKKSDDSNQKSFPKFNTAEEYSVLVLNDEDGIYETAKPQGYVPILFGDTPTDLAPDGVSASVYALVDESLLNNADLGTDYPFYLETHTPDSCWVDVMNGDMSEKECPEVVKWYGPFDGPVFEFVQ